MAPITPRIAPPATSAANGDRSLRNAAWAIGNANTATIAMIALATATSDPDKRSIIAGLTVRGDVEDERFSGQQRHGDRSRRGRHEGAEQPVPQRSR